MFCLDISSISNTNCYFFNVKDQTHSQFCGTMLGPYYHARYSVVDEDNLYCLMSYLVSCIQLSLTSQCLKIHINFKEWILILDVKNLTHSTVQNYNAFPCVINATIPSQPATDSFSISPSYFVLVCRRIT